METDLIEWAESQIEVIVNWTDINSIKNAKNNSYTLEEFITSIELEAVQYIKYYGEYTLVSIGVSLFAIKASWAKVIKEFNSESLKKYKHIKFYPIPSIRIAVNVLNVLNVNEDGVEFRYNTVPIRGLMNKKNLDSFKLSIKVLKE